MKYLNILTMSICLLLAPAFALAADLEYEVTITNLTKGTLFTPVLVVTHTEDISLFTPGEPALEELATLAESGATADLQALLDGLTDVVSDTSVGGGPIMPGATMTIPVSADSPQNVLSFAGMLVPTNDTFVALNSMSLPRPNSPTKAMVPAWDAGSEANDELCENIPGPQCGDQDDSGSPGEGYVYIGNGIQGIGDLNADAFDWNNPVAWVQVRRVQ